MIIFPYLRTKRVAVQLREITLGEAIAVCRLPADRHEATTTEFLRRVASKVESPSKDYVTDPRLWTVEERARVVCHYLSEVASDGADFAVGSNGCFSDYVVFDVDLTQSSVAIGTIAGKDLVLGPLLGVHVEYLERVCNNKGEWLIGMLACMTQEAGSAEPDWAVLNDGEALELVQGRIAAVNALSESDFEEMYIAYERNAGALRHFFDMGVNDQGVVFWPQSKREGGPDYPARFRSVSCISEATRRLFG